MEAGFCRGERCDSGMGGARYCLEVGVECALVILEVPVWFKHTLF